MTAEEVLTEAARLVEKGWVQGWMRTPDGLCMTGALRTAAFGVTMDGDATNDSAYLRGYLALCREIGTDNPALWNDEPGRTVEEVATALRNSKRSLTGFLRD